MVKMEDILNLINDHYENLLRVDHKLEFSRPQQLSEGTN